MLRGCLFSLCLILGATAQAAEDRPPNVVIIYTDDQGTRDTHAYGAEDLVTPAMDRLAAEGIRGANALGLLEHPAQVRDRGPDIPAHEDLGDLHAASGQGIGTGSERRCMRPDAPFFSYQLRSAWPAALRDNGSRSNRSQISRDN